MHVRIGVTYNPREIEIELPDDAEPESVRADVEQSIASGGMLEVCELDSVMKKTNEMAQLTGDSFQVSPEAQTGQESDQSDRKQRRKAEDAPGPQHLSFDVGKIQRKG